MIPQIAWTGIMRTVNCRARLLKSINNSTSRVLFTSFRRNVCSSRRESLNQSFRNISSAPMVRNLHPVQTADLVVAQNIGQSGCSSVGCEEKDLAVVFRSSDGAALVFRRGV